MNRPQLPETRISQKALGKMERFKADVVRRVAEAVDQQPIVVVGMAQNPHVKRARKALTAAGRAFEYIEYGSYLSGWRDRLAIKLWSGWPTFPQVFVRGTLIGGNKDVRAALADGTLRALLG